MYGYFNDPESINLILEFCGKGELTTLIRPGGMCIAAARGFIRQICEAVQYMHNNFVIHVSAFPPFFSNLSISNTNLERY